MSGFKDEEADVQEEKFINESDMNVKEFMAYLKNNPENHVLYNEIIKINPTFKVKDEEADVQEEKPIKIGEIKLRYFHESYELGSIVLEALNAPKNVSKQAGRTYGSWIDIIALLREEVDEFEQEMIDFENGCFENAKRCKEELADVGACCVLLSDWIKSREEK